MRLSGALLILTLLLVGAVGFAVPQATAEKSIGSPHFTADAPDNELVPGEKRELDIYLTNRGRLTDSGHLDDMVRTAYQTRIEIDDEDEPIAVKTDSALVGTIPPGQEGPITFDIAVDETAEPGTYDIPVEVTYRNIWHAEEIRTDVIDRVERTQSRTVDLEVAVVDRARFEVSDVETDVGPGESGTLRATVTNIGGYNASDLRLELATESARMTLGDDKRDIEHRDTLEPGETTDIAFDLSLAADASAKTYAVTGTATFEDERGLDRTQSDIRFGVDPLDTGRFDIEVTETTLRVGETGSISGEVMNVGPTPVDTIELAVDDERLEPTSGAYSIDRLEPNESADFHFRARVPETVDGVPQRFDVQTQFDTQDGSSLGASDGVSLPVGERRPAITLEPHDDQAFAPGEDGPFEVTVTNQRPDPVEAVKLVMAVEEPIDSDVRHVAVSELEGGESQAVAFEVDVDRAAIDNEYPATVDISYTDPTHDTVESVRPTTISIPVSAEEGPPLPTLEVIIFLVLVATAGGLFIWLYRR